MSIIFYHNEKQKRLAIETKKFEESLSGYSIVTEIVPFSQFYLAEAYHQKYYLRQNSDLLKEFRTMAMDGAERRYLRELMVRHGDTVKQACDVSGLGRTQLYKLLKKHGIARTG